MTNKTKYRIDKTMNAIISLKVTIVLLVTITITSATAAFLDWGAQIFLVAVGGLILQFLFMGFCAIRNKVRRWRQL